METLFGFPIAQIAWFLGLIALAVLTGAVALALRRPVLLKLGARNAVRRPLRSLIIVAGLALSTIVIATAFSTGDAMTLTVRSLITGSLGQVDEVVTNTRTDFTQIGRQNIQDLAQGSLPASAAGYFPASEVDALRQAVRGSKAISGLTPAILEQAPAADGEAQQARANVGLLAIPADGTPGFEPLRDSRGAALPIAALAESEVYVNRAAVDALSTGAGHLIHVYLPAPNAKAGEPPLEVDFRVQAVAFSASLGGSQPTMFLSLSAMQERRGRAGQINEILVANRGGDDSSAPHEATLALRRALVDRSAAENVRRALVSDNGRSLLTLLEQRLSGRRRDKIVDLQQTLRSGTVTDHLLFLFGDPQLAGILQARAFSLSSGDRRIGRDFQRLNHLEVIEVRQGAIDQANAYGSLLTSVFIVLGLFSIAASMLLVFLLFAMLAAERRTEMGISRAVGMQRTDLLLSCAFEGLLYALAATLVGVGGGLLAGRALLALVARTLSGYGINVQAQIQPHSLVIASGLGLLVTVATIVASAWRISRLNIVEAIHGLPARGDRLQVTGNRRRFSTTMSSLILPLILITGGAVLAAGGLNRLEYPLFGLGVSLLIGGLVLLLRRVLAALRRAAATADRVAFSLAGLALIGFWLLPPGFFDRHGQRLLTGGMETFALAGLMMVLGAVWIVTYNLSAPLQLLMQVLGRGGLIPAAKMAIAYPLQHRFRTGTAVAMFSLVVFTMIAAAVLLNSARLAYVAQQRPPTGYDIRASAPEQARLLDIQAALASATATNAENFAGIGSQATLSAEVLDPLDTRAAWRPLTLRLADAGLVRTTPLRLSARAQGYATDQAVWEGLLSIPGTAVVARGSLPGEEGAATALFSRPLASESSFPPRRLWLRDPRGGPPAKLTIVGVVDDASALPAGLLTLKANIATPAARAAVPVSFLFKVRDGEDPARAALGLNLSLGPLGLQTHVAGEGLRIVQNVSTLLNYLLEGFVGLGLVAGMAALGVISLRAVAERRQQIGMLRAIGMQRRLVQLSFLLEASFTAWLGIGIGVVLGLLLARSVVTFLAVQVPQLQYEVPWVEVGVIVALAYAASLAATLVAAWQAGRIEPAEALRYE